MTSVRTDLMTWPLLLPFRQPMIARSPSRDFVVPFFVSVVFHTFLVFLLGVVVSDRTAFVPTAPSIDTHLIVSLTTFDTASQNELDREAVSVVPNTSPPAQRSQFSPERSHSAERKAEAESIVATIDLGIPGLEVPDAKSLTTDATPSIDLEAISRIALEGTWIHRIALEGTLMHCIEQEGAWIPCIDREDTWISKSEVLMQNYEYSMHIIKRNRALLPPDCRTAYANMGLLGIPFLIKDAITGNGCKW